MTAAERLAGLIRGARSVVALTGAGISAPSGIPDFRSPGTGLWADVDPMEVAHISVWRREPERFWSFYGQRFALLDGKEPNGAHRALASLEEAGRLDAVITQNIDGLHRAAGTRELIEIHGSVATASCLACGTRYPLAETRARLPLPRCDCGAVLKPDVVLFGELLDEAAMERASALASGADLMLCIGSSLEVYPAAGLPELTLSSGGALAIVTRSSTPYDGRAAVRLGGDVVAELAGVAALVGHWRPLFLRFAKGGKTVATTGGVALALATLPALAAAGTWILVFLLTRYASVASIVAGISLPLYALLFGATWPVLAFTAGAALAILVLHRTNIRRLLAGTENRIELRRPRGGTLGASSAPLRSKRV